MKSKPMLKPNGDGYFISPTNGLLPASGTHYCGPS